MKLSFFLILLLLCKTAITQSSFHPAHILKLDGKEEAGFVSIEEKNSTPDKFLFAVNPDGTGNRTFLTPFNTASIKIEGSEFYKRATVTLYHNLTGINNINYEAAEPSSVQTIFLRRLFTGDQLSLYQYKDALKEHFFIEDKAEKIQTLRYVEYLSDEEGQTIVVKKNIYREQFGPFIQGRNELKKYVERTSYKSVELINLVQHINTLGKIEGNISKELKKKVFTVFVSGGLKNIKMKYFGSNDKIRFMNFKSSFNPSFSTGIYLFYDKRNSLSSEFNISAYPFATKGNYSFKDFYGKEVTNTYEFSVFTTTIGTSLNYKVINYAATKLSFGIGINIILSNYLKNKYTTTDTNPNGTSIVLDQLILNTTGVQYFTQVEYSLANKIAIQLIYAPQQDFSSYSKANLSQSQVGLQLKYSFAKF